MQNTWQKGYKLYYLMERDGLEYGVIESDKPFISGEEIARIKEELDAKWVLQIARTEGL